MTVWKSRSRPWMEISKNDRSFMGLGFWYFIRMEERELRNLAVRNIIFKETKEEDTFIVVLSIFLRLCIQT